MNGYEKFLIVVVVGCLITGLWLLPHFIPDRPAPPSQPGAIWVWKPTPFHPGYRGKWMPKLTDRAKAEYAERQNNPRGQANDGSFNDE